MESFFSQLAKSGKKRCLRSETRSSDPTAKISVSSKRGNKGNLDAVTEKQKRIAVSQYLHEPVMYTTKGITNEMTEKRV